MLKAIRKTLLSIFSFFAVIGIGYGIMLYFYGVTSISAQDGEKPITAKVYVNDEYKGETPLKVRLGPGWFDIKIVPPTGYRGTHQYAKLISLGAGLHISEDMVLLKYHVKLYAPAGKSATFEVADASKKPIGVCDGTDCEIPLPGPGYYHANMKSCEADNRCSTGSESFNLNEGQEEMRVSWNQEQ